MLSTIFFVHILHHIQNCAQNSKLFGVFMRLCMHVSLVSMHKIQFAYGFLVANIYLRFLISMCSIHRIWNVASQMCKCKGRQSRMSSVFIFFCCCCFVFNHTQINLSNMQRSESAFKRIQIKVRIFQIAYICNELS